jgi:cytochrome c oxidase cbb3-type subunit 3
MSNDPKLLDHEYDGIKELDNQLPKWWLQIFYVSIVFSVVYMVYYHFGGSGKSPTEDFESDVRPALIAQKASSAQGPNEAETLTKLSAIHANSEALKNGEKIFVEKCQVCHAPGGAGLIGPNLTDEYWIHGGSALQIVKVITVGVAEKGMIPWDTLLSPEEILQVTAYIQTLKGTTPANPKAPQGEKVAE